MIYSILVLNVGLNLMNKFTYKWYLKDLEKVEKCGLKVFSCFACGGGSTMGYKMSGCEVIGCNEIDPEMMQVYRLNHNPKYYFLEGIQTFKNRNDLPKELYELDILDGSPPCSSFSMAGNREKNWGEKKKFREGQEKQILDDLFFHFIELANKLRPKVVIAENVKGLIQGNAKGYVKQIINLFKVSGYNVQLFLLNAASMGVPQKRERIFFIAKRNDLEWDQLKLCFNEKIITLKEIESCSDNAKKLSKREIMIYDWCKSHNEKCGGKASTALFGKRKAFNFVKSKSNDASPTLCGGSSPAHWYEKRYFGDKEILQVSSFPLDFKSNKIQYQCGMSVPPLMIHKIVEQIKQQWFNIK